ncbi:Uncharacterised protein [Sebaldella termitidis]|uniref:Uncharacterized protein n=1 Tax=Sebaldella termitidis (strain ATCC 33386 / NCTC 11300) TaxID=526218 RepID=D1AR26_SEBTE|nr:hypothetical protein [Sebaldella termitidis]ACZ07714.1 hypothetical protein Sterm_0842 [Sebaldella termitidis ATCC 33386]SUI23011.1 Uncharacterised protein [Sebaldella termitidis]
MEQILQLWTAEPLKVGYLVNIISLSENKEVKAEIIKIISQDVNEVGNWFNVITAKELGVK